MKIKLSVIINHEQIIADCILKYDVVHYQHQMKPSLMIRISVCLLTLMFVFRGKTVSQCSFGAIKYRAEKRRKLYTVNWSAAPLATERKSRKRTMP